LGRINKMENTNITSTVRNYALATLMGAGIGFATAGACKEDLDYVTVGAAVIGVGAAISRHLMGVNINAIRTPYISNLEQRSKE